MSSNEDIANEVNYDHQFVIQLDRDNGWDFKCYDVGTEKFRAYVADKTGYTEPDRRSTTDIRTLCREIAGVNLCIGYHHEHGNQEYSNVAEWEHTLNTVREWLSEPKLERFALPFGEERTSPQI